MAATQRWLEASSNRFCPLCSGDQTRAVSCRMQHGLDLRTVVCERCSFVFTDPLPGRETYERFYTEAYADYYGHIAARPSGARRDQEPDRLRCRLDQIDQFRALSGSRLLEVGPGQGLFLWWAQRRGSSVLGVEPSPAFCETLIADGLPCMNGRLEELQQSGDETFDIVTMFHVLEHMYDPNSTLAHCAKLLRDGGVLVIEVPNILKPFRSLDRYFLRYVHPSNFSPQTLQAMLEKHGFLVQFVDEGGSAWHEPQNLFLIAEKASGVPHGLSLPRQTADEVFQALQSYRMRWRLWLGPAWHAHSTYLRGRRMAFGLARYLKHSLTRPGPVSSYGRSK